MGILSYCVNELSAVSILVSPLFELLLAGCPSENAVCGAGKQAPLGWWLTPHVSPPGILLPTVPRVA